MRIGFIGLGQMGSAIAENLLQAGHQLAVYNRSGDKALALVQKGARMAARVSDCCEGAAVVFTMLADDTALEAVALGDGGLLRHLEPDAVHVCCATISVTWSERLSAAHADAGQRFVAAPVFGRPAAAAAAQLFVVAAGSASAIETVKPLLDAIGQRTFVVSDRPEAANLVKLSGNFLIASVIEALGEALALVGKGGVDRRMYLDLLTSTLFNAPIYKTYGALLVDRTFEPAGFAAPLGMKDLRLTLAAAEDLRVPMPLASLLRDRLLRLLAAGGEDLDWSAFGDLASRDASAPEL